MRDTIVGKIALLLIGGMVRGATVVLPTADVNVSERQDASELAYIWRAGTGQPAEIRRESQSMSPHESGPWFYVGDTALARALAALPAYCGRDAFRIVTMPGKRIVLRGTTRLATGFAVYWYAQHAMGVRWFMPGDLGQVVPSLRNWAPPSLDRIVAPAYVSRGLGGLDLGSYGGVEWARRNGLHGWLPHAHALASIFPAELFDSHPDWFPMLDGRRHRPSGLGDYNWQPNIALPEVATYAAMEASAFFDRQPEAYAFSLSINDSLRFDQTESTMQCRGPLRWFRKRPDYSDLVFTFMNRVADQVRAQHPDKFLSAYAYQWCENRPSFSIRANIIPWLTADRSQWYDHTFRDEDRDLIRRWCGSGAKIVGIYDYLYGAPFLVPRQTTRLTAQSIKFAYLAGARAYYAESYPNWALDGPKLWVTAQLLWDPNLSVDDLLKDYYGNFWGRAAAPMRRFYEGCEAAWDRQPGPGWWLKYYQDEDQAKLFPSNLCKKLRTYIDEARNLATEGAVHARIEMVSNAFAVTESFVDFCEARTALSLAVSAPGVDRGELDSLLRDYQRKRARVLPAYAGAVAAGGIARTDLEMYLRDDPAAELGLRLGQKSAGLNVNVRLVDPKWLTLRSPQTLDDRSFTWNRLPWSGQGEPVENRSIEVGSDSSGGTLTYRHCKFEQLQQWTIAIPNARYKASVRVRGRISSGNQTFLMVNWLDRRQRYMVSPVADRLPEGDWTVGKRLVVTGLAPAGAAYVGLAIFVYNQVGDDFATFSALKFTAAVMPMDLHDFPR